MNDYSYLGLSPLLNSKNSLSERPNTLTSSLDFDSTYERGVINTVQIRDAAIDNAKLGTAVIGTANIGTLSFNEISGGTISVTANMGGTRIRLEGGNSRIIVNDGTTDRILIGSQLGGF